MLFKKSTPDLVVPGGITGAEDAIGLGLVHVLHHLEQERPIV
jgi:hypothetical protein